MSDEELTPDDPRLQPQQPDRYIKPRRTPFSNSVFHLPGGNEDNDLWTQRTLDADRSPIIASVFVPTDEQRQLIADGQNIELVIWGDGQPPVAMLVTEKQPGKPPSG